MTLEIILFILFALIGAASGVLMITRKNPVMSALFLILNFAALAGIYLLLNAQFIAVVQIIVYAGAIMVLFLFVIMLLRPDAEISILRTNPLLKYVAIGVGVLVFAQLIYLIFFFKPLNITPSDVAERIQIGTVENIGTEIYTKYIIPVQVAGFLLLSATIGALVLAKKKFE
ncbi:MAG TPA: NADH-quinone oxidoreductase subunit J [Ignavibacteriaceae bacterium]|nr:NADH-quinone oxidoreductase subunit J [Ignavibacteriaceae bacterium]